MKIKELIELLQKQDLEMEVFTSIDSEGNGYHSVNDYSYGFLEDLEECQDMLCEEDFEDNEYDINDFTKVFVLWD